MKISVMIITYNRKREILRALESCVCNKIEEMEFVIVDNNSSDGTQEAVEKFFCENNIKMGEDNWRICIIIRSRICKKP